MQILTIPRDVAGLILSNLHWPGFYSFALTCKSFADIMCEFKKEQLHKYLSALTPEVIATFPQVNTLLLFATKHNNRKLCANIALSKKKFTRADIIYNILLTFDDDVEKIIQCNYSTKSNSKHEILLYSCFAGNMEIFQSNSLSPNFHNFIYDVAYWDIVCIDRSMRNDYFHKIRKIATHRMYERKNFTTIIFILSFFTETLWKSDNICEEIQKNIDAVIDSKLPAFMNGNRLSRVIFLSSNTECANYVVDAIAHKISDDKSQDYEMWKKITEETFRLFILRYLGVLRERGKWELIRKIIAIIIKSDYLITFYAAHVDKKYAKEILNYETNAIYAAYKLGGNARGCIQERLGNVFV